MTRWSRLVFRRFRSPTVPGGLPPTVTFSLSGAGQPPNEVALLRMAETEAWLGHVHVTATMAEADVHGDNVAGAELELYGVSDRGHTLLDGPGTVAFPVAEGLPASAWLWLKRQCRWLDYRSIDARSGWTTDLARAGVTIEQPAEPQANIEALIASGEGPQLEFKEQLPSGPQDRQKLKTVAAFATGRGGSMVFGVNRDEMTVNRRERDRHRVRLGAFATTDELVR